MKKVSYLSIVGSRPIITYCFPSFKSGCKQVICHSNVISSPGKCLFLPRNKNKARFTYKCLQGTEMSAPKIIGVKVYITWTYYQHHTKCYKSVFKFQVIKYSQRQFKKYKDLTLLKYHRQMSRYSGHSNMVKGQRSWNASYVATFKLHTCTLKSIIAWWQLSVKNTVEKFGFLNIYFLHKVSVVVGKIVRPVYLRAFPLWLLKHIQILV